MISSVRFKTFDMYKSILTMNDVKDVEMRDLQRMNMTIDHWDSAWVNNLILNNRFPLFQPTELFRKQRNAP